ncbi:MAG TPA: 5-deoxy-glucuronate isomerase [Gaiellaceae bacterium]|nr:5-deoxy-glucuronate isomerase [Gaiellaceae bacterium]
MRSPAASSSTAVVARRSHRLSPSSIGRAILRIRVHWCSRRSLLAAGRPTSSREPSTWRSAAGRSARRRVPATCSRAPTHALELVARRDAVVVVAGTGSWARSIRTILGPDDDAGRLVLGETINPPGSWSPSCGAAAPRRTRSSPTCSTRRS